MKKILTLLVFFINSWGLFAQINNEENTYHQVNRDLLEKFNQYSIVAVGEVHQSTLFHKWLKTLVNEKDFSKRVQNIVVEFGTSTYQSVMDDFISGKDVPDSSFKKCWRETSQMLVWDYTVYENFFREVRKVNQGLPKNKQIRVLLGDPPSMDIDRDLNAYEVIKKEVIDKKQTAFIVYGCMHLQRRIYEKYDGIVKHIENKNPFKIFSIWTRINTRDSLLHTILNEEAIKKPSLISTSKSRMGNLEYAKFLGKGMMRINSKWTPWEEVAKGILMKDVFNAILFIGSIEELSYNDPLPENTYDDSVYLDKLIKKAFEMKKMELRNDIPDYLIAHKLIRTKGFKEYFEKPDDKNKNLLDGEFKKMKENYPEIKWIEALNDIGYELLNVKATKKAIALFEFVVMEYPKEAGTYDSLAEAYMKAGNKELAIKNYEKSLELNPQNTNAVEQLKTLKSK